MGPCAMDPSHPYPPRQFGAIRSVLQNCAGVTSMEYVVLFFLVGVVAFTAFRHLGGTVSSRVAAATVGLFGLESTSAQGLPQASPAHSSPSGRERRHRLTEEERQQAAREWLGLGPKDPLPRILAPRLPNFTLGQRSESMVWHTVQNGTPFVRGYDDAFDVSPDDVDQGYLGDCFLVGALSALATSRYREQLESGIHALSDGTYFVRLYENGEPVLVTLSPTLPKRASSPALTYAHTGDHSEDAKELWAPMYEKALAVLQPDGYETLEQGGSPGAIMEAITGQRARYHRADDMDVPTLYRVTHNGGAVAAVTIFDEEQALDLPNYREEKLHASHTYFVTRADLIDNVFVLGNPWGEETGSTVISGSDIRSDFSGFWVLP